MKKSFLGFLILFILFTTYLPKFHLSKNFNFFIKDIKIDNNYIINDKEIIDRLKFLYSENLFFLDTQKIKTNLKKETFIQSYSIKKIYPDTLRLLIVEKRRRRDTLFSRASSKELTNANYCFRNCHLSLPHFRLSQSRYRQGYSRPEELIFSSN